MMISRVYDIRVGDIQYLKCVDIIAYLCRVLIIAMCMCCAYRKSTDYYQC